MTKAHVLVCDDENDLREMVGKYLQKREFTVSLAANAEQLDEKIGSDPTIDLVLLDVNMPGEDGLSVLRRLHADGTLPVIMLTAAGEAVDRVLGLEMGADDYLAKPVDLRELEARIKAVLRRINAPDNSSPAGQPAEKNEQSKRRVDIDGLTLDLDSTELYGRNNEQIPLTAMEFSMLELLVKKQGRVLNRDQLMELAFDREWDPYDRSIDIRIMRLRKKIERNPTKPKIIRTVRGMGYIFDPAPT